MWRGCGKPACRSSFKQHRCLILADGVYESEKKGKSPEKLPTLVGLRDGSTIAFAGLWEQWPRPARRRPRNIHQPICLPRGGACRCWRSPMDEVESFSKKPSTAGDGGELSTHWEWLRSSSEFTGGGRRTTPVEAPGGTGRSIADGRSGHSGRGEPLGEAVAGGVGDLPAATPQRLLLLWDGRSGSPRRPTHNVVSPEGMTDGSAAWAPDTGD
jgi:hypothetical protein